MGKIFVIERGSLGHGSGHQGKEDGQLEKRQFLSQRTLGFGHDLD